MFGKQIWIIEDDGNRLVKLREVQQCWKSTRGQHVPVHLQHVPVHLQHVPVHLCRKVVDNNMYRYTTNMYRYTYVKTAGIEQAFDPNERACLSINF